MSTIALNRSAYAEERREKVTLKERVKKYFRENAKTICAGLLMLNGNTNATELYRLLEK